MNRYNIIKGTPVPEVQEEKSISSDAPVREHSLSSDTPAREYPLSSDTPLQEAQIYPHGLPSIDPRAQAESGHLIINNQYSCSQCGYAGNQRLNITLDTNSLLNGDYCIRCYARWIAENVPRVNRV